MIQHMYSVNSLIFVFIFLVLGNNETKTSIDKSPPCSIEGIEFLLNISPSTSALFVDFNALEIEKDADQRCVPEESGGNDDSCYTFGACPGNNSTLCDIICETNEDGCTVCWICRGSYP